MERSEVEVSVRHMGSTRIKQAKKVTSKKIPGEVAGVLNVLEKNGHEAYVVGGCVRDLLRGVKPIDWDIATNASSEEIQSLFPDTFYANAFGTVTVKLSKGGLSPLGGTVPPRVETIIDEVEVTTYRVDETYTDKRHPDSVRFTRNLEDDLKRRDFTINALAMNGTGKITDLFDGIRDLETAVIRAVGDAQERFSEDALRMMRAVRFATILDFVIEPQTLEAIKKHAGLLSFISKERVRDEFVKIIESRDAEKGVVLLQETGLLKHIVPELEEGIGVAQNKHHIYTIWEHNIHSLGWTAKNDYPTDVRIASLFHDIGKSRTKRGEGLDSTFYGHEVAGARMAAQILERLKFSRDVIEKVTTLVRYHLFYYNVDEVTENSVRRLIGKVGRANMDDLILVRIADRKGSGVPKAEPYKIRHFRYIIEKVSRDPVSPKMLEIKGDEVMAILKIEPGPRVGEVISILLDEVLDDPKKNEKSFLTKRIQEIGELSDGEVSKLAYEARKKIEEAGEVIEEKHKKRFWVK